MKIKIALLDKDYNYLNRIVTTFNTKYTDKLETHSFTSIEHALATIEESRIDVLVASDNFEIDIDRLPDYCGFAYFVDTAGVEKIKEQKAICKYQKAEVIYKQILNLYAEKAAVLTGKKSFDSNVKVILFTSFSGGVGASTLAAAFSLKLALSNIRVLYLNFERMGDSEMFFQGDGQFTFGDVLYAIKSKKANLSIKIESSVKTSPEGVDFFASPKVALDMMEMKSEEIEILLNEIGNTGNYDYIVIDEDYIFDEIGKLLWNKADEIIIVSDGSESANSKLERTYNSLTIMNQKNQNDYRLEKTKLIYNKFSNKTSKTVEGLNIIRIGGLPRYDHATTAQVVKQIALMGVLDKLM